MHIVLTENCTADGVIDLAAGWFDPTDQTDDELLAVTRAHMSEQDALLLGRNTFESFRSFWPNQTDDSTGISDHLNHVQKYVLSTSLQDPGWEPTMILRDFDEVRALRDRPGRLGVTGSISVAQQLVEADLIDEYRLFVYPVLVGDGLGSWRVAGAVASTSSRPHPLRRGSRFSATTDAAEVGSLATDAVQCANVG